MEAVNPYKLRVSHTKCTPKKKKSKAPDGAMANVSPPVGRAQPQFGAFWSHLGRSVAHFSDGYQQLMSVKVCRRSSISREERSSILRVEKASQVNDAITVPRTIALRISANW